MAVRRGAKVVKPVRLVDVSLDFDFWIREDVRWDFGHGETPIMQSNLLWAIRYGMIDLYGETDIDKYADFHPMSVLTTLMMKGLRLATDREIAASDFPKRTKLKRRRVGIAESHKEAYDFFRERQKPADVLLSIDAHHDLYNEADLDCGNWLVHYMDQHPDVKVQVLLPWWDRSGHEYLIESAVRPSAEIGAFRHWKPNAGEDWAIRDIFLCRSGAWVPPHHDQSFMDLCSMLSAFGSADILDDIYFREAPTAEESEMNRAAQRAAFDQHREIQSKIESGEIKVEDAVEWGKKFEETGESDGD